MAAIEIRLSEAVEAKARAVAKASGKTVSRWIADQIVKAVDDSWPAGVLGAAGAMPDFPSVKQIRKGYGRDTPRESME
jgi:hypothetical protein